MSETNPNPSASGPSGADSGNGDQAIAPSMRVLAQYVKDLSFENPRAPHSFNTTAVPEIEVNVDVQARNLGPDQYEVELSVAARAMHEGNALFVVETSYAGAFEIKGLSGTPLELAMLVECPRLLFPFMRQVIADATRNGNYPPLMMEPIDFMAIYQSNTAKARAQANAAPGSGQVTTG